MSAGDRPRVVAAAIIGEDGVPYHLPPPARHHDVIRHMIEIGHKPPVAGRQGFMLSDGAFANRRIARVCAELNNQLLPRACGLLELYSEDVW